MRILSYIFPQTLLETSSAFNKIIRVNEEFGQPKLLVNGSRQSGRYIDWLWKKAFSEFGIIGSRFPELKQLQFRESKSVQQILVVGVAGGTVIHLLRKNFPQVHITAVDIDSKMIEIGKKYFGLIENDLNHFIVADGETFIQESKGLYDGIIVDVFIGRHIPDFVLKDKFMKKLRRLLTKNGFIVWNYLQELEYEEKSNVLMKKLQRNFPVVLDYPIERNRFFYTCA